MYSHSNYCARLMKTPFSMFRPEILGFMFANNPTELDFCVRICCGDLKGM